MSSMLMPLSLTALLQAFVNTAHAASAAPPAGPSLFEQFLPFIILLFVFYFFILRPQSKKARSHQQFLSEMKRGDSVMTTSGILGRIEGITDKFVTLEVADGVRLKVLKHYIAGAVEEKAQ